MDPDPPLLSIVVPVGPGDHAWRGLLRELAGFPGSCQIVLSATEPLDARRPDGASKEFELMEVTGAPGRAAQLNRGAAAASARCLWLVHADCRPGAGAMAAADGFARACGEPGMANTLGWFDLAFAADGPRAAALNAVGANLRSRLFGLPFGDQSWLMSRALFRRVGGFDETFGRGEDLDFIVRARRAGTILRRMEPAIETSARRYRERGWMRTTLAHVWLTLRLWLKSIKRSRKPLH